MPRNRAKSLSVHASLDRVHVRGDVEQDLRMVVDAPLRGLLSYPTPRSLDLLTIASGVYAVDRAVKRVAGDSSDMRIRTLRLNVAVHDLSFWQRAEITEAATRILCFLTDDNWSLTFEQAAAESLAAERQMRLEFPWNPRPRRVALFSGGLDSAAGLANRVLAGVDDYLLSTVGHHSRLHRQCAVQVQRLGHLTGTPQQLHATLVVRLRGGVANRMSAQEQSQRSRAFLFGSAAAVVAQACDLGEIEVFENGVGAINLPLMTGMLAGGMATRGAHPTFLRWMGELASHVAERPMRFTLPFATLTKAEMLRPLRGLELGEWLQVSRSCVHTSLRARRKSHCGRCPGCIERRQAFAVAGIDECVDHYEIDLLADSPLPSDAADYLRRYLDDAADWLGGAASVRRRLAWHLKATDVPSDEHVAITSRQHRHAREVIETFGQLTVKHVSNGSSPPRRARASPFPGLAA
jgi:7-cyano-7-deazaguanine synthase in queuosine biosynthesis